MAPIHILKLMKFDNLTDSERSHLKKLKKTLHKRKRDLELAIRHVDRGLAKKGKRKVAKKRKHR
jgi:hypothetical protein